MATTDMTNRPRTVRRVLAGSITGALVVAVSACSVAGDEQDEGKKPIPHQSFVSRPDLLPPEVKITEGEAWSPEYAETDELTFLAPNYGSKTPSDGAMILDAQGELVWMSPASDEDKTDDYFDLRVQEYEGEPVLTVYQGSSEGGRGDGEIIILDQSYEEIARVTTGGSLEPGHADFHDSTITEDGTMLISAYEPTPADLSEVGGPEDGYAENAIIQEIDIATGEVVFEWSALDHVPVTDTKDDFGDQEKDLKERLEKDEGADEVKLGTEEHPFDYFHLNSITEDDDGSLLVSARHTSAVYRLDRTTGEVDWTLGGKASDFEMGGGAEFAWQHDAHRAPDGTLTLFDNHAHGGLDDKSSRGLRLSLDEEAMTAEVATEYLPPEERKSGSMANAQELDNGNMVIGWGARPHYSEYTPDGKLIYDVCHGDECYGDEYEGGGGSYRAYKAAWEGRPSASPDVTVQNEDGEQTAYVSWNGATEVAQWRLVTGEDEESATAAEPVDRESFETSIPVPEDAAYIAVEALDAEGNVLGTGTPE
ncbi:arylsulfotransferase family protein [Citricoccus sp. GCM10030269]|uniref:arylsulfotransferase family protein n=1 Tax=Citricoccus sp. GCM10030269 TaxID=3273388 RepID=UPI00361166A2